MKDPPEENVVDIEASAEDLVRFFRALPGDARREYQALAARDLERGEDVSEDLRVLGHGDGGSPRS